LTTYGNQSAAVESPFAAPDGHRSYALREVYERPFYCGKNKTFKTTKTRGIRRKLFRQRQSSSTRGSEYDRQKVRQNNTSNAYFSHSTADHRRQRYFRRIEKWAATTGGGLATFNFVNRDTQTSRKRDNNNNNNMDLRLWKAFSPDGSSSIIYLIRG